jgi:hypothetical protein
MNEDLRIPGVVVRRDVVSHPLLGAVNEIEHDGRVITVISALDWDDPSEIPIIADPARLPPGAGGILMNELARRAKRPLRYAGPYPTPALYRALARSFRPSADERTFTRQVMSRALRVARDEVAVDFAPAPHERVENAQGHVEIRDGIEGAVIAGTRFDRDGSVARIVDCRCEIWFGDACYAHIATLSPRGELLDGPHAPPPLESATIGRKFPGELRVALAELIAEAVPEPLAADARTMVAARPIAWADLGARAARRADVGFEVHAAIWERVAPHGLTRVALAIAEALAPVVTATLVSELGATAR